MKNPAIMFLASIFVLGVAFMNSASMGNFVWLLVIAGFIGILISIGRLVLSFRG